MRMPVTNYVEARVTSRLGDQAGTKKSARQGGRARKQDKAHVQ
jgi:hypothetical protein